MSSSAPSLRSRRPGSASSSLANAHNASNRGPTHSHQHRRSPADDAAGKARRPSSALGLVAILLLTVSATTLVFVGKRGVTHGLDVARRLMHISGDDNNNNNNNSGRNIRGGSSSTTTTSTDPAHAEVKNKIDQALIDAAHEQRKDRVDAALNVASATSAYKSSTGEPVDNPNNMADHLGSRLHVVFSTDCGTFQHWQSYLLFYSALRVGQPGRVTRIASGCKEDEEKEAISWFDEHVKPMSSRFGIHLTPHFSTVKNEKGEEKGDYKFFNKPFGLRHWLENGEGMGIDKDTGKMVDEDVVVILIDPDMLFLRPITSDYSVDRDIVLGALATKDAERGNRYVKVEKGKPFGQTYGFGNQWRKNVDVSKIVGEDTPALQIDDEFARLHYPVGPPYIGVASDMHTIAVGWTDVVPQVHKQYPNLLAEMFGYCLAAAHNELPHQRLDSLMISAVDMNGGEGWDMVDKIPAEEVCGFAAHPDHNKYAIPNVVHFCQRYGTGPYFFGKRRVPHDIFTCESPLMIPPPPDSAVKYDYRVQPDGKKMDMETKRRKREAFVACAVIQAVNEAAAYFKRHHCGSGANWDAKLNGSDKGLTQAEIEAEGEELKERKQLNSETAR